MDSYTPETINTPLNGDQGPASKIVDDVEMSAMYDPAEVQAAASFLKLISDSSLGTPEARDDRLEGRREISRLQEESPDFAQALAPPAVRLNNHGFDLAVADELESCDRTFEAELRYRSVASGLIMELAADTDGDDKAKRRIRRAALALAPLLDAKGFSEEALRVYARATQADDANATWRLAVISHQVGCDEWAVSLARLASTLMSNDDRIAMHRIVKRLYKNRKDFDLGRYLDTEELDKESSSDTAYAIGSALLILSERADLASLAYCSALSRGHTLAAISLLDIPGIDVEHQATAHRVLAEIVQIPDIHGRVSRVQSRSAPELELAGLIRLSPLSDDAMPTLEELMTSYRLHPNRASATPAIQRMLLLARTTTILRGYFRIGCDIKARKLMRTISDHVSREILRLLQRSKPLRSRPIIQQFWKLATDDLDRLVGALRLDPAPDGHDTDRQASAIRRYRRALARLSEEQRQVVLLRICGLTEDDVLNAFTPASATAPERQATRERLDKAFEDGTRRLRYEQRGEQHDAQLWEAVESAFPPHLVHRFKTLLEHDSLTTES